LVMGPCMEPLRVSPETEEVGLSLGAFDLKGVMDWETPEARVNCSRSSTLVRPFEGLDWAGAELFLELLLDLRLRELWDRDVGRSAAIAAIVSIATGQNHSWFAWQPGSPWITTG